MKKTRAGKGPLFFKRHWLAIVLILVATLSVGGFLYWQQTITEAKVESNQRATLELIAKADEQIKAILKQKAEQKAQQEAEAKEAAEQAREANNETAAAIDSGKCNLASTHNNPASIDVMVNKKHCIQPLTYAPSDLITSNGATLSAKAIDAYNQLFNAAAAAGQGFYVTSSYRSYSDQVSTYNYWVGVSGRDGADTYSARPGYSEHQTGLVFDVAANGCVLDCFGATTQYTWLQQHAAEYGFIQRYIAGYEATTGYKAEEWHYRYVGKSVALDMQARGIKTLEQYWAMPGGDYY